MAIGISPGHLAHVFRLESGSTVKSRLRSVRIEVARSLVADTDAKLEVIARAVGFYDAAHVDIAKTCTAGDTNATDTGFVWTFSGNVSNPVFGTLFDVRVNRCWSQPDHRYASR
jgi:AraC-like DNA-binding protein